MKENKIIQILSIILTIIILGISKSILFLISTYIFIFTFILLEKKIDELLKIIISFIISLLWMFFASKEYAYNKFIIYIFGLNLFPLLAWSLGLFGSYKLFDMINKKFKFKKKLKKISLYLAIYWPLLIILETIFYHCFGVHDINTDKYQGLPICNCIHAPHWMQISYFLLGPIYFISIEVILKRIMKK